jgi:predicted transcriptional regulator of viral defense system
MLSSVYRPKDDIPRIAKELLEMHQKTVLESLEEQLARNRRRVVSDWRTMLLLQKALKETPETARRWSASPANISEARSLLHRLASAGNLTAYRQYPHLYKVTSAYAQQDPIEEDEILMELHPYAALSHLSAMAFHQITDQLPKEIHVSVPSDRTPSVLPVGTKQAEWLGQVNPVRGHLAPAIEGIPINWHHLEKFFGFAEYTPKSYPVRVMTLEKTLIDGLSAPDWCGGLTNVLQAWVNAKDAINLRSVITFTDRQDMGVLRQRVGYVLEKLGFSDPQLNVWTTKAKRGGSSKLLASAPFAPVFSERWMISLNASIAPLEESL